MNHHNLGAPVWNTAKLTHTEPPPQMRVRRRGPLPARPKPPGLRPLPCVHEGNILEWCPLGAEERHVRECDFFDDKCTRGLSRIRSCVNCTEYKAPPPPEGERFTRHLAYYVCPFHGTGTWQRNLDRLIPRMGLFNGKRVVAVATGVGLDPPGAVEEYLSGLNIEVVRVVNDPRHFGLREVVAWEPLWSRMPGGPQDVTFFAHAKAVTRPWNPGVTCHTWASIMYETLLDYWPVVEGVLREKALAGPFKKVGFGFSDMPDCKWHYSGTFLWVRNAELFRRDWKAIPEVWYATEAFWGVLYDANEAGVVFHTAHQAKLNMYDQMYIKRVVDPELAKWRAANAHLRTACEVVK